MNICWSEESKACKETQKIRKKFKPIIIIITKNQKIDPKIIQLTAEHTKWPSHIWIL